MANGKVKIVGYSQRQYFDQGIEYRNFSDELVGQQQTDVDGLPYSIGNIFDTEFNNEGRLTKNYITNKFSKFVTLSDIDLSTINALNINDTEKVSLNFDKTILTNYCYFGSLKEYIRVSLEKIILNWPASIYLNTINNIGENVITFEDYDYDSILDSSTFKINVNGFVNPFNVDYMSNSTQLSGTTNFRSLTLSYLNDNSGEYILSASTGEFDILNFTGSTNEKNDYVYLKVKGDPFSEISTTTSGSIKYHIKPNNIEIDKFFNNLNTFESYLLNRYSKPKYKAIFNLKLISDSGRVVYAPRSFKWPVSDGYNIDFQSNEYVVYVNKLIKIADDYDENETDILTRLLVSKSIIEFDTVSDSYGDVIESSEQKINKTLKIYGRNFDEIKRYADNIKYAYTVSYDKKDNIPDNLVKTLAETLGWDLISNMGNNEILSSYITNNKSSYSGLSHGNSIYENEIEFWRRLIINTPWLWKSKGTRKGVEFLLKFIGTPQGLIDFKEYIYKSNNKIDMGTFNQINLKINNTTDISSIPITNDGYPSPLPNNTNLYYQQFGSWYRQTAGSGSTIEKLTGNNPHIGPYDGGKSYFKQFEKLIDNFSAVTLVDKYTRIDTDILFTNYQNGEFLKDYVSVGYIIRYDQNNNYSNTCYDIEFDIIESPHPNLSEEFDNSLKITVGKKLPETSTIFDCKISSYELENDGTVLFTIEGGKTNIINPNCCRSLGFYVEGDTIGGGQLEDPGTGQVNTGETKCYWDLTLLEKCTYELIDFDEFGFGIFLNENNEKVTVVNNSECCSINNLNPIIQIDGNYKCEK